MKIQGLLLPTGIGGGVDQQWIDRQAVRAGNTPAIGRGRLVLPVIIIINHPLTSIDLNGAAARARRCHRQRYCS